MAARDMFTGGRKNTSSRSLQAPMETGDGGDARGDGAGADGGLDTLVALASIGDIVAQQDLASCYAQGKGVPQDWAKAVGWFELSAESGNTQALHNLGCCHQRGLGVPAINHCRAAELFKVSAVKGYPSSQHALGVCCLHGLGLELDQMLAVCWFKKAAEAGHTEGQCALGCCYDDGLGVERNPEAAVTWFVRAAEKKCLKAMWRLGDCYLRGSGVKRDPLRAVELLTFAAEAGHAEAQSKLGELLIAGAGVPANHAEGIEWLCQAARQECRSKGLPPAAAGPSEGLRWLRAAATAGHRPSQVALAGQLARGGGDEQLIEAAALLDAAATAGDVMAMSLVGDCYGYGRGVARSQRRAVDWYRRGAEAGGSECAFKLGLCYMTGEGGLPCSPEEATRWWAMAAKEGQHFHSGAANNLGAAFQTGQGVAMDTASAFRYFMLAAQDGHSAGLYNIGRCCEKGDGCPQSWERAAHYFQRAAEQGYSPACHRLAKCYQRGYGVQADPELASMWSRRGMESKGPSFGSSTSSGSMMQQSQPRLTGRSRTHLTTLREDVSKSEVQHAVPVAMMREQYMGEDPEHDEKMSSVGSWVADSIASMVRGAEDGGLKPWQADSATSDDMGEADWM